MPFRASDMDGAKPVMIIHPRQHSLACISAALVIASIPALASEPAQAQEQVEAVRTSGEMTPPAPPPSLPQGASAMLATSGDMVELVVTNDGERPLAYAAPTMLPAVAHRGDTIQRIALHRVDDDNATAATIPAHGFRRFRYRAVAAATLNGSGPLIIEAPSLSTSAAVLSAASVQLASGATGAATASAHNQASSSNEIAAAGATTAAESSGVPMQRSSPADAPIANDFLPNLSAYQPIYALVGGGPTNAKLQVSFKYQLFGQRGSSRPSWLDGFHLAYTQTMFWALSRPSSPFRVISYQPELLYILPLDDMESGHGTTLTLSAKHESNGRDGRESRSVNILYAQPSFNVDLDGAHRLVLSPRAWVYVGPTGENPRIQRYRGNFSITAEIGENNGWKLSTWLRGNPGSGKGAAQADLSYPLAALLPIDLDLYLHAQAFTGYGENILDYDRKTTRLRFGISIIR